MKACGLSRWEDSVKRRKTVSWDESGPEFCEQADTQELMIDSGCFGHVAPPWFAPQFPVVSASTVEAAAANDVALQHYGQKGVDRHVTTTSGRRVSKQITCGVMSVRKPLLSTSALKRRRVTINFNHHYDRINFRTETVHLVSNGCHSCLRITLANGVPHRKAMVMTGENVSMNVDDEVYTADGDEMPEAQEASDGDRRAIADADQAGQLASSGETKTPRALRTSEPPTDAARMQHYTTSRCRHEDWCPCCVASRVRGSPHRRVVVNKHF